MRAMVLSRICDLAKNRSPLELSDLPVPETGPGEILIKVSACGVCHTELDEIEGRTPPPRLPVVPGHQVVGRVVAIGSPQSTIANRKSEVPAIGDRVGVAWIFSACGKCEYCRTGQENLCLEFRATGRDANGGYAEYMTVPEAFAYPIPATFTDAEAAPLLCAGAVGYRSLRLAGINEGAKPPIDADTRRFRPGLGKTLGVHQRASAATPGILGLTGFGASGHLVLKLARHLYPQSEVYVFARSREEQSFARELGAAWAGDTADKPPQLLDAIIDTTPAWSPIIHALANLKPGGRLVINAIRKEEADKQALLGLDYARHLWMEKEVKSVANVTRRDVSEFLALAAQIPIKPEVQEYPLEAANQALLELKERRIRGAKVLRIS